MKITAFAALALLATTAAAAEPKVVEPDWIRQPTEDEIFWAYPPEAVKGNVAGKAAIKCMVDEQGDPQLCVVVSEQPAGMGFGQAAVSMRKYMKFRPKTVDGKYAPAEVTIPINFKLGALYSAEAKPIVLTPRQEALAKRLIAALGMEPELASYLDEWLQQSLYYSTDFDAEERRIVSESIRAAIEAQRPKLGAALAADLVATFSDEELERVTLFFETPEGGRIARRLYGARMEKRPALEALVVAITQDAKDRTCQRNRAVCNKLNLVAAGIPERK